MRLYPWLYDVILVCLICLMFGERIEAVKRENRCMRHYLVHTVRHPTKKCEKKVRINLFCNDEKGNVLMARCEGFCSKSRTDPLVSFSPVLYKPFKHRCTCCKDRLSVMKAVRLRCENDEFVYATYRYILRCSCQFCNSKKW
ncbi:hypothetical protein KUTeg_012010 [Tegillarca granosa]|uniref:CTCK domain-containing protein n=1 Tax=Tegillarca granosa TaxID=220873 RepID=A0ABQ9EYB3_TEGGR|nr:hypothetical protein KUTeg_012010 [Tegillarca granosa]